MSDSQTNLSDWRSQFLAGYSLYSQSVQHFLWTRTRDHHLSADIAQDLWALVYKSEDPEFLRSSSNLVAKAYQLLVDYRRKSQVRSFVTTTETGWLNDFNETIKASESDDPASERSLEYAFWEQLLPNEFPELDRRCFWLKFRYGHNLAEISQKTGLPKSTIQDRIEKTRLACMKHFNEQFTHE